MPWPGRKASASSRARRPKKMQKFLAAIGHFQPELRDFGLLTLSVLLRLWHFGFKDQARVLKASCSASGGRTEDPHL